MFRFLWHIITLFSITAFPLQCSRFHTISVSSAVLPSSHLRLVTLKGLFFPRFPTKIRYVLLRFQILVARRANFAVSGVLKRTNNYKIFSTLLLFSHCEDQVFFSPQFYEITSFGLLSFSLGVRYDASQSHQATGEIMVLCIFILTFVWRQCVELASARPTGTEWRY
jgi:hypothetical protein